MARRQACVSIWRWWQMKNEKNWEEEGKRKKVGGRR